MWWLYWPAPYGQGGDCGGCVGQHQIVSEGHSLGIDTIWMWWLCWTAPYIQGGGCGGCFLPAPYIQGGRCGGCGGCVGQHPISRKVDVVAELASTLYLGR
jgi:hypothetical protein